MNVAVESIIAALTADGVRLPLSAQKFTLYSASNADMLRWTPATQIQLLPDGFTRIGTVGDGNCMLHSMLFSQSPIYRQYTPAARSKIVDEFRAMLQTQESQLRGLADILYSEIGGASALEESFEILRQHREEINIELGPLIARLFGANFLALQLQDSMAFRPVRLTWQPRYDSSLPTILVNYIGGGLNFGHANFQGSGHYETIIHAPMQLVNSSDHRKTRKASTMAAAAISPASTFMFESGNPLLEPILDLFRISS